MKRTIILFLGAVLALVALVDRTGATLAHAGEDYCANSEEQAFLVLVNDFRAENGLEPLVLSQTLSVAAEHHSRDSALENLTGHTGSDGSTAKQRLVAHGYTYDTYWAENVFAGDDKAAEAFKWWENSPGHRRNMLDPNYVAIGIDRAYNTLSEYGWYWTTTFGGVADAAATLCPEDDAADPDPADPKPADPNPGQPGEDDADDQDDNAADADRTDSDDDGLYDDDETDYYNTDPDEFDTDGDGVGDGEEVYYATDPLDATDGDAAANDDDESEDDDGDRADRDDDGLYDDDETDYYGTDPDQYDTDGDGTGDGEEVYYGTDPLDDAA